MRGGVPAPTRPRRARRDSCAKAKRSLEMMSHEGGNLPQREGKTPARPGKESRFTVSPVDSNPPCCNIAAHHGSGKLCPRQTLAPSPPDFLSLSRYQRAPHAGSPPSSSPLPPECASYPNCSRSTLLPPSALSTHLRTAALAKERAERRASGSSAGSCYRRRTRASDAGSSRPGCKREFTNEQKDRRRKGFDTSRIGKERSPANLWKSKPVTQIQVHAALCSTSGKCVQQMCRAAPQLSILSNALSRHISAARLANEYLLCRPT